MRENGPLSSLSGEEGSKDAAESSFTSSFAHNVTVIHLKSMTGALMGRNVLNVNSKQSKIREPRSVMSVKEFSIMI